MAGRNPREAVINFLEPLKDVVRCITYDGFVAREFDPDGGPYAATFQSGSTILERKPPLRPIKFDLIHRYTVIKADGELGPWKVSTAEWNYEISDAEENPIVAFHWHPESGRIEWPHTHVYGSHPAFAALHKLHFPTGRVSIEAVVRSLIDDLNVQPTPDRVESDENKQRRRDWRTIVNEREMAFMRYRSWH